MIIICPSCQARYKFDEAKLGDRPRAKTRCAKCGAASAWRKACCKPTTRSRRRGTRGSRHAGGWWKAENIVPGKAFTCAAATPQEVTAFVNDASSHLAERSRRVLGLKKDIDSLHDRQGHFIAVTENAPAIDTLKGINWMKTRTYITGPIAKP